MLFLLRRYMERIEKYAAVISWTLFFLVLAVICVLSFQNGSATKALEKPFVDGVTGTVDRKLSTETILTVTFYIRQAGRAVLFLVLGFSGGNGALLCFGKRNRTAIGAAVCAVLCGISYFTEKYCCFGSMGNTIPARQSKANPPGENIRIFLPGREGGKQDEKYSKNRLDFRKKRIIVVNLSGIRPVSFYQPTTSGGKNRPSGTKGTV